MPANPTSLLCYRNWCAEYGRIASGSALFETAAPLSNALTYQAGQLAILADTSTTEATLSIEVGAEGTSSNSIGRPVGMVALVNTNVILDPSDAAAISVTLTDEDGGTVTCNAPAVTLHGSGEAMQTIVFDVGNDGTGGGNLSAIVLVTVNIGAIFGSRDPWSGAISVEPFQVGTIVAGPAWRPSRGIRLAGAAQGIGDNSPRVRSIGETLWAAPQTRMRTMSFELSLPESEIEAEPPLCGLRQLAEWCGVSRPLIVVPHQITDQYAARQSVYGYLEDVPAWPAIDKSGAGIEHRVQLTIRESK
jgi:hypothetical protein